MVSKKFKRRSLEVLIALVIILATVFIVKSREGLEWIKDLYTQRKGLVKMVGIHNTSPEKLASYQSVSGVLDIQYWLTENGVPVYFVRVPTLPMVDVELVFDAGAARNGTKGGLAYLTNQLLAEGTAELSAEQVAENFDDVGAQYTATSQRDMANVHLRSLSQPDKLVPAVQTLAAILSQPAFAEQGFKREQQNMISSLKLQAQSPEKVAMRAFYSALYPQQPYANWVLGDESAVKALTQQDVKAFHQQYYVAKNVSVAIVGDVTAQEADALAQTLTRNLPQGAKPAPLPAVPNLSKAVFQKIHFPSHQTHLIIGEPGVKQGDPDFYALNLGNHVLGGNSSVTRLFDVIRNQHGLAYSVASYFIPMKERGPFILMCQTRNDQAEKARTMLENQLKQFVSHGPTQEELDQAKQNLVGGYALSFDSNQAICRQLAAMGFYSLPLNYFNEFKPTIEKLTIADVKAAFQKRISPQNLAVVMLGNSNQEKLPDEPSPEAPPQGSLMNGSIQH